MTRLDLPQECKGSQTLQGLKCSSIHEQKKREKLYDNFNKCSGKKMVKLNISFMIETFVKDLELP